MKKLLQKDKNLCFKLKTIETEHFVLKSIFQNSNFFSLLRWNAFLKLRELSSKSSKVSTVSKCLQSINKKRFNKLTCFSRQIFLKLLRSKSIPGVTKAVW